MQMLPGYKQLPATAGGETLLRIPSKPRTFSIIAPRRVPDTQDDHSSNPRPRVG